MNTRWLYNRLSVMSFPEVLFRVRRTILTSIEGFAVSRGWQPACPDVSSESSDVFYPSSLDLSGVDDQIKSSSNSLAQGRLDIFDYRQLDVGFPVRWHSEPLTKTELDPDCFGKTMDYRDEARVGDVKVIWELGRSQFMVPIAVQYQMDKNNKHLEVLSMLLSSWLEQNPFGRGIHWCSSLEAALRVMSWSMTHQILRCSGLEQGLFSLPVNTESLKRSIFHHAWFIRRFLSLHSSGNNHLIGELTGLFLVTSVFSMGDKGRTWRQFAWKSLLEQSKLQVYNDGVGKEQAVYYHAWVLEYFIIAYKSAVDGGIAPPSHLFDTIAKMAQFLSDLSPGEQSINPPQIGDADDGVAIAFCDSSTSTFYDDLVQAVADMTGQKKRIVSSYKAACYRSRGRDVRVERPEDKGETAYPAHFPDGGYAVLGEKDFHLVFDAGSLGYPEIAAHGHADALSVCLAVDSQWWLVDPGTYAYHASKEWRDYFRGTRAHNTLQVNNIDQSISGGAFLWLKHASTSLGEVGIEKNGEVHYCSGKIQNYQGAPGVVIERSVAMNSGTRTVTLSDRVSCESKTRVSLQFHFAPDVEVKLEEDNRCRSWRPGADHTMEIIFPESLSLSTYRGDEDEMLGWYSPALGSKQACNTVVAEGYIQMPTSLVTQITVDCGSSSQVGE